jgi:aconitase A
MVHYFKLQEDTIPNVARDYKSRNQSWVVVADQNYGEGSAREHAALQPRYLGCKMIVARSFARIHETNLKKQGIVPVTFLNPEDYDKIKSGSIIETLGLKSLAPGSTISLKLYQQDGSIDEIPVIHTMSKDQIQYFKHGSALNLIAHSTSLNTGMAYDA